MAQSFEVIEISKQPVLTAMTSRDRLVGLRVPQDEPDKKKRNVTFTRAAVAAWLGSGSASLVEFTGTSQAPQDVAAGTFYYLPGAVLAKYVGTATTATVLDPTDTANWQAVIWLRQRDRYAVSADKRAQVKGLFSGSQFYAADQPLAGDTHGSYLGCAFPDNDSGDVFECMPDVDTPNPAITLPDGSHPATDTWYRH